MSRKAITPSCVAPPDPALLDKIASSRARVFAGEALPQDTTVDLLDMRTLTLILGRSPSTRRDTFGRHVAGPVMGTRKALVLLVDFSDKAAVKPQEHYREMLFSAGTYPSGSLHDFYREASYGKLTIEGLVSGNGTTPGWYRAPQPKSYYTNNDFGFGAYPNNSQKLVEELVALADPYVNFSEYDNDGDGVVDALIVLAAGSGGEQTGNKNDIWSHAWAIPTPITKDGVQISGYFIAPEDGRVGVMAHELGHSLMHWPDLYDTDYTSQGTGSWDLMAGGSWNGGGDRPAHPTAYCKVKAGWIAPTVIFSQHEDITCHPYASNAQAYKLPIGSVGSDEYFLLSNRQKSGFDDNLPGGGLLIEHVDESQTSNTDENHYLVDIEQCDGSRHLNKNINRGDAGDVWPTGGKTLFDKSSTPGTAAYDGTDSRIAVSAIAVAGADITATVRVNEKAGAMSSIVGTWSVMVDWGNDGTPAAAYPFTFNNDGTWAYQFGGGRWYQVDGIAAWNFSNAPGLIYTATVTYDSVTGAMGYASAPPNPGTGSFYMIRKTAAVPVQGGLPEVTEGVDMAVAPRTPAGAKAPDVAIAG